MATFSISGIGTMSGHASNRTLKPFEVHNVKFEEAKIEQVEIKNGTEKGSMKDVLKVRFSNDFGYYEETIFLPSQDEDATRQANQYGENPSNFDNLKVFVIQTASNINPEKTLAFQKAIQDGSIKIEGDIKHVSKSLAEVFVKLVNEKKGHKVNLKLIGRIKNGQVRTTLPYYAGINKQGEPYPNNNFIADAEVENPNVLTFTAYELKKKAEVEAFTPTTMPNAMSSTKGSEDLSSIPSLEPTEDLGDLQQFVDKL